MSTRRQRAERKHRFDNLVAARATRVHEPSVYAEETEPLTRARLITNLQSSQPGTDAAEITLQADGLIALGLVVVVVEPQVP